MAKAKSTKPTYQFPNNFHNLNNDLKKQFYKPQPTSIVSGQIITIDNFFSKELCDELIKSFETQLHLETTPVIKSKGYALRINDRAAVHDFESSQILWNYLRELLLQQVEYDDEDMDEINSIFQNACGLNPNLRIYRYLKGHHFNKHYDESVKCQRSENGSLGKTKWTLLIYLTGDDEFVGGGTIFHPDFRGVKPLNIHPSKGMALLHKHGDDCLMHEGEMVKSGAKWVFRSDVVYPA